MNSEGHVKASEADITGKGSFPRRHAEMRTRTGSGEREVSEFLRSSRVRSRIDLSFLPCCTREAVIRHWARELPCPSRTRSSLSWAERSVSFSDTSLLSRDSIVFCAEKRSPSLLFSTARFDEILEVRVSFSAARAESPSRRFLLLSRSSSSRVKCSSQVFLRVAHSPRRERSCRESSSSFSSSPANSSYL